ncbi:alpha/beta hydrolase [Cohaesibacter celericrescens]|uniref:alpha/beta hydrolase n=1 Tax=Cohaesibacter celericrescens TaxID=2067669 RepID=UPI0035688FA1
MSSFPDADLLKLSARYSYKPNPDGSEPLSQIRIKGREIRKQLVGRHVDDVVIADTDFGRSFTPIKSASASRRVVVYIHGGGWRNCDVITHSSIMTDLAAKTGCDVLGVSYPLAPEAPYPAALDAVIAKVQDIHRRYDCDLILAGDSAGANLALATALRLRDEGETLPISALLLWYGCYRQFFDTRSHAAYGDQDNMLMTTAMKDMWNDYTSGPADPVYADLTDADMTDLPPCYLCEAECDCLADDTKWLASKLVEAGVPHFYDFYSQAIHGFIHYSAHYKPSLRTLEAAARFVEITASKD